MDDTPDLATPAVSRPSRRVIQVDTLASIGLIAVLVTLVVTGVGQGRQMRRDADVRADRSAAVKAARSEVLALTQVSTATSDEAIRKLIAGATDDFQAQLQDQAETFRAAVSQSKVTSTGSIAAAGLTSLEGAKATVLVAASGTVKNTKATQAAPRTYRMTVRLEKVKDRWLVAGLEFVA
jgi:Mce-associated membrane protein